MACHTPIKIQDANKVFHHVPCGKCGYCRLVRIRGWIFRLVHESNKHTFASFVTLTYDIPPKTANGLATLDKRHPQLFLKRLRKATGYAHKYYLAGEYGSKTRRPHYHIILFGATDAEIAKAWEGHMDGSTKNGHIWPDEVNEATIAYTAKYIDKGKTIPMFKNDDRLPEFSLMSKGMGIDYLTPQIIEYHRQSLNPFAVQNGHRIPLPRYFKDKIYTSEEKGLMYQTFTQLNKEKYEKQVALAGSEERYIQNLNERLWQNQRLQQNLNKIKRDKI